MRFCHRGGNRRTLLQLCIVCVIVGLLQLNTSLHDYQQTAAEHRDLSYKPKISSLTSNANQSVLSMVTTSSFSGVLLANQVNTQAPHSITRSPPLRTKEFSLNFSVEAALQYGHFTKEQGFLTIAIPSIKREGGFTYLHKTLDSIIQNTDSVQASMIRIVVMFSDDDEDWNADRALNVSQDYQEQIDSGLLQILTLPHQNYPDFNLLPRTYNDSVERLKWRSKQNVHYAFLFRYCHNISMYYLHLEDDVIVARNFVNDIKNYKKIQTDDWFYIRFSNMGFIGVFFRSSDLLTVSDFYLLFYAVQPCDYLINLIAKIKLQTKDIRFRPSLFQHQGIVSSLKSKRQPIVDRYFKGAKVVRRKKYYNINPQAEVDTTMVVYEDYKPSKAYKISDMYFWAVSPQKGQTYTIILQERTNLTALIIVGGFPTRKTDVIVSGEVQVSSAEHCTEWTKIGVLVNGSFDSRSSKLQKKMLDYLRGVTCIQIEVTKSQTNWAIISEIALLGGTK